MKLLNYKTIEHCIIYKSQHVDILEQYIILLFLIKADLN